MDNNESYEPRTSDRSDVAAVVRVERRRRWSDEQKLAVLRETTEPDAIVSMVARRHGINTGQLYTWRKQLLQGAMSGFIPVDLTLRDRPIPVMRGFTDAAASQRSLT